MGVTLAIQITAPVDAEDRDLISAVSMLLFALGQQGAPPSGEGDEVPVEPPERPADPGLDLGPVPAPCGAVGESGFACVGIVGHRGRHLFRRIVNTGGIAEGMN